MASSELYQKIPLVRVQGFTHDNLQGEDITVASSPFKQGHIDSLSTVGVFRQGEESSETEQLRLISEKHGRSFEMLNGQRIFWADEFGNLFMSLNSKGNNLQQPSIFPDSLTRSGYRIQGMQEGDSLIRMSRASRIMRSLGIDTEVVVKAIEPVELPVEGKLVSLEEFKQKLVQDAWDKAKRTNGLVELTEIPDVSKFLDDSMFFITVRAVQVNERLADASPGEDELLAPKYIHEILANALQFVNKSEEVKAARDLNYKPDRFNHTASDVDRYINDFLPKKIASNLAKLHNAGLIHVYPHSGNISWTGALLDLDSVRGEPLGLGDDQVAVGEKFNDVKIIIGGGATWVRPSVVATNITFSSPAEFEKKFLRCYLEQTGMIGKPEYLSVIVGVCDMFSDESTSYQERSFYLDRILEELGVLDRFKFLKSEFNVSEAYDAFLNETGLNDGNRGTPRSLEGFKKLLQYTFIANSNLKDLGLDLPREVLDKIEYYEATIFAENKMAEISGVDRGSISGADFDSIEDRIRAMSIGETISAVSIFKFWTKFIEKNGFEDDIGNNAQYIEDMTDLSSINLEGEGDRSDKDALSKYLTLFTRQTGIDFTMDESTEDVVRNFHRSDQEVVREKILKILSGLPDGLSYEAKRRAVEDGLYVGGSTEYLSNKAGQDRYIGFVWKYVVDALVFDGPIKEEFQQNYGEENAAVIFDWFERKWCNKFYGEGVDFERIDSVTERRVRALIHKYAKSEKASL